MTVLRCKMLFAKIWENDTNEFVGSHQAVFDLLILSRLLQNQDGKSQNFEL